METQEKQQIQQPSFWAVLPAKIRYDKEVDFTSKVIFAEITALSNMWGYCSAGNQYFADRFGLSVEQISRIISKLIARNYIRSVIEKAKGNKRQLYPLIDNVGEEVIDNKKVTFEMKFDKIIGEVPEELKGEREKFIRFYSEKSDGGRKEYWQTKKTFSMKGRWATWIQNYREWKKPTAPRKTDTEIREEAKREAQKSAEEKAREEASRPRTPEEQKQYEKKMADLRNNMQSLFNKKL